MDIDFDGIEQLLSACESEQVLQEVLENLQDTESPPTKEEAIIRLLIDLPISG